jgi:hypothetical protein
MHSLEHHNPEQDHKRKESGDKKSGCYREEDISFKDSSSIERIIEKNQENTQPKDSLVFK